MLIARFISHVPATHIVAYALDDRKIVWQKELSEPLSSSISQSLTGACDPASGLVFIPNGTNLWAFDVKTGDVKWTYSSSASVFAPTLANGVLYFISGTNAYAADMLTGAKLAHFPLGYTGYDNSQVAVSHGMLYFSGNGGDCDLFALGWP
jgi:outer membrane protein assembly factor BamB